MKTWTREQEIENAKMMLDGARTIYAHCPSEEYRQVVADCEAEMNDLLDGYTGGSERGRT